jgi:hypothetical protein
MTVCEENKEHFGVTGELCPCTTDLCNGETPTTTTTTTTTTTKTATAAANHVDEDVNSSQNICSNVYLGLICTAAIVITLKL